MTDNEIRAIKSCKLLLNGDITLHIIDDDGGTAYAGTVNKLYNEDLETVLNLIQTQQEEIEQSNKVIDKRNEEKLKLVEMCLKKDKIINNSINEIEKIRQYFSEDLQVEFIRILEILKDKKSNRLVEYFIHKVEKENK